MLLYLKYGNRPITFNNLIFFWWWVHFVFDSSYEKIWTNNVNQSCKNYSLISKRTSKFQHIWHGKFCKAVQVPSKSNRLYCTWKHRSKQTPQQNSSCEQAFRLGFNLSSFLAHTNFINQSTYLLQNYELGSFEFLKNISNSSNFSEEQWYCKFTKYCG